MSLDPYIFITKYVNVNLNPLLSCFGENSSSHGIWKNANYFWNKNLFNINSFEDYLDAFRYEVLEGYETLTLDQLNFLVSELFTKISNLLLFFPDNKEVTLTALNNFCKDISSLFGRSPFEVSVSAMNKRKQSLKSFRFLMSDNPFSFAEDPIFSRNEKLFLKLPPKVYYIKTKVFSSFFDDNSFLVLPVFSDKKVELTV